MFSKCHPQQSSHSPTSACLQRTSDSPDVGLLDIDESHVAGLGTGEGSTLRPRHSNPPPPSQRPPAPASVLPVRRVIQWSASVIQSEASQCPPTQHQHRQGLHTTRRGVAPETLHSSLPTHCHTHAHPPTFTFLQTLCSGHQQHVGGGTTFLVALRPTTNTQTM